MHDAAKFTRSRSGSCLHDGVFEGWFSIAIAKAALEIPEIAHWGTRRLVGRCGGTAEETAAAVATHLFGILL